MFSISLEVHYWAKMWSFTFLVQVVFILSKDGAFYMKITNF